MKFSDILALSSLLVAASAAPMKRTDQVEITFHGAAGAQFTQSFSTDGTSNVISNVLSISQISSATDGVECTFTGIDGSSTTVDGATRSDVGPPQTQVSGVCTTTTSSPPPSTSDVTITFIGAADAQFTQNFPTDGSATTITNVLSISHIASSTDGVECTFSGIDGSSTTVSGAVQVDVGPPQTQVSGTCSLITTKRRRSNDVSIKFIGAADAEFSQSFPTDGRLIAITNPLSISHIAGASGVECHFSGVDGSYTTVDGAVQVDVGPPQTQVSGSCTLLAAKRSDGVSIKFIGAADAEFSQSFPTDGRLIAITNPLSISHIAGADGVECHFSGIDGSYTTVEGASQVDVGPPQTQVSGSCSKLPVQRRRSATVSVKFIGAAGAEFTQDFPTNDHVTTINNVLSISHIEVDAPGILCSFDGIDNSHTSVYGPNTVDVGPPQTQISGHCRAR